MEQQQYVGPPAGYSKQQQHQYGPQQQVQLAAAAPCTGAGPYQQQPGGYVQTLQLPAYQEAPYQQQQPQQQWQQPVAYQPWQQLAPKHPQQPQDTNQYVAPPAVQQQQAVSEPPVPWANHQPLQPRLWPGSGQQQQQQQQQQQVYHPQSIQHWQHPASGPQQQFQQQQQYAPPPPQQQQWAGGAGPAAVGGQLAQLGSDQQKAIEAVQQGHCVFLTGGAGVGKSFTVEALVQMLQDKGRPVAVTASTGTAALNVNGMTIHSWAGILDYRQHPVELAEKLWGWDKWMAQWEHADVLVLDEISMVDCDLLDKVDYLARYMRGWRITQHSLYGGLFVHELHPLPFGGLQVIAVGDFFQLPPVDKEDTWNEKPVRQQQQAKEAKEQLPPGTVIQKVPVIMALLPPEAVDAHVEARAAKLANNTVEARDLEYQMHYGVRPVRQQQQQFQPLPPQQQQYGGFAAPGAAAAAAAGGWVGAAGGIMAPPYGCMHPQTAWQLLHLPAPPAAAAAAAAAAAQRGQPPGAAAGAQCAAANLGQPAIKQHIGPHQQQQQLLWKQERLEGELQSPSPFVQQQQRQQQEEEQQEPLSPLLPTQVFPDVASVQQQHQQQQPGEGFVEPALKRRRTADAERLDVHQQQQQQLTSPGAQGAGSSAGAGSDAAAAVQQPAAAVAAADGGGSSNRRSGSPDEDDLSYDAISAAIQQAESQSRSQQQAASPLQQRTSQWLSPQQQPQQQGSGGQPSPAKQQQQQYGTPPRAAAASQSSPHSGTPYHSARSVPRSALSALRLMSQAPLPFGDSFGMQQQQQQQQQQPAAGDAAADAAAIQAHVDSTASDLLPCTQQDLDLLGDRCAGSMGRGVKAGGGLGVLAAAGAAAVVAAAAVPLPADSPTPGAGRGAAGQHPNSQEIQADVPTVDSAAAAAAAGPAAGGADAAAAPGSPDVVVLDSQEVAAAGTADPAGLDLTLGSPAGSQGAAAPAGAGAGEADSEVIEILDSDSPPATPYSSGPIDLTMTPPEDYGAAATKTAGQQLGAAAAAAPAAACEAKLGQQEQAQQQSGWLCEALFGGDQTEPASAAVAAAAGSSAHVQQPQQHHQHQHQQQAWQPHQQHTWQQQQGWSSQQHQRPLMQPPGTVSPATGLRHLSIGQGNPAGSTNSAAAAAAAAAVAASAASNSNHRRSSRYAHLLQMLERAANMPLTPPTSPRRAAAEAAAAAAAAGGAGGINPERYHDKNQREARDVCGCLFSRGLARSRLFEVKEVALGHVYGRSNGRMKEAWQAGSLIHPKLHETRPEGYDWSPTSSHNAAAAAASNPASGFRHAGGDAAAGSGGGTGGSSGGVRQPLQFSKSPVRAAAGASGGSGAAAGVSRWDVPRLPVQFLKSAPTSTEYCFKSPVWAATKFRPIILREAYRQSDPELLDALNELRLGSMTERTCCLLSECKRPLPDDGIGATHLFPVKKDADKVNKRAYDSLSGPELLYASMDTCDPHVYSQAALESRLDTSTNASRVVRLKPGTQVLLLSNIDVPGGLANGTRGVVEGFVSTREYLKQELVRFPTQTHAGRDLPNTSMQGAGQSGCDGHSSGAGRSGHQQQPGYMDQAAAFSAANLRPVCGKCTVPGCPCQQPAWSELVVNRQTQSITVKAKLLDADEPETLELPSDRRRRDQLQKAIMFTVSKRYGGVSVAPWDDTGSGSGSGSATYKWLIVGPRSWQHKTNTQAHFGVQLERVQVPLLHAWAISIHKSQGMSISKLVVNVQRSFTAGMVYTALSRCTSRDGLQIVGDVPAPQSSNDVKSFYQYLFSIEHRYS